MIVKKFMISGLQKQHRLLAELIECLEDDPESRKTDRGAYAERTCEVVKNLNRLRKLSRTYCQHLPYATV